MPLPGVDKLATDGLGGIGRRVSGRAVLVGPVTDICLAAEDVS